eukprot:IDg21679t1
MLWAAGRACEVRRLRCGVRCVRTVINRAKAVLSRKRQRHELSDLRDHLRVKHDCLGQLEGELAELAASGFERKKVVLAEITATVKLLVTDLAELVELTASVKFLEAACKNPDGACQPALFKPVPARVLHPLSGAAASQNAEALVVAE